MAESHSKVEFQRPDVQPGNLVFLDEEDWDNRSTLAACLIHGLLVDKGLSEGFAEAEFFDMVTDIVRLAARSFGVVDFSMDPETLGKIYSDLDEGIRAVS